MLKRFVWMALTVLLLTGCADQKPATPQATPNPQVKAEKSVVSVSRENERYLLVRVKESHFSLDIGKHIKNSMNSVEVILPTSVPFYDEVKVGDNLLKSNGFRVGSLIFSGNFSDYEMTVLRKAEKLEDLIKK